MRIAVLVKQIPAPGQLSLDEGRVVRDGVDLEVNAYCRRANAKAIELAGPTGEVVVFTMGPPTAEDALREMIACGATRGVHLCDQALAGSDTLATARGLAAALRTEGHFDLVLAGLNSLDADTGQVPPELAEMLRLPFASGVRDLELDGNSFTARLETDRGYRTVEGELPIVLSTAERLCAPSKAPPEQRALIDPSLIRRVSIESVGLPAKQCGVEGSPTTVGLVRVLEPTRRPYIAASVPDAVQRLIELGAFRDGVSTNEQVPASTGGHERDIWCFFHEPIVGAELLGEAAALAAKVNASVTAVVTSQLPGLGALGADSVLMIADAPEPAQWAEALASAAGETQPWALFVEGTRDGRVVASIVAARHGWGLTGDAIGFDVSDDSRLVAWKPAFGGRLEAPITSSSPVQMATVRPGVLPLRSPRQARDPQPTILAAPGPVPIRTISITEEGDDAVNLHRADVVVAVGQGVDPSGYPVVDRLCQALGGAALGSTRKVTDQGWLPRTTQIGVTGHSVAPRLLVAVASSGRFNHTVGIRNAGVILAVNDDPEAEIFEQVDVGLVGRWQDILPALTKEMDQSTS